MSTHLRPVTLSRPVWAALAGLSAALGLAIASPVPTRWTATVLAVQLGLVGLGAVWGAAVPPARPWGRALGYGLRAWASLAVTVALFRRAMADAARPAADFGAPAGVSWNGSLVLATLFALALLAGLAAWRARGEESREGALQAMVALACAMGLVIPPNWPGFALACLVDLLGCARQLRDTLLAPAPVSAGVPALALTLGAELVPLLDAPGLAGAIAAARTAIAADLGITLPEVVVTPDARLKANAYALLVKGDRVAGGELLTGYELALPGPVTDLATPLAGFATHDPATGQAGVWVMGPEVARARQLGYVTREVPAVLGAHLEATARCYAHELLSREAAHAMVEALRQQLPATVAEVYPGRLALHQLHRVFGRLLREGPGLRDLPGLLERLADLAGPVQDPDLLAELVRLGRSRGLCAVHADEHGMISAITLDGRLDGLLKQGLVDLPTHRQLVLDGGLREALIQRVEVAVARARAEGFRPVLLCDPVLRPHFWPLLHGRLPDLAVLSFQEIHPAFRVQTVGTVSF